MSVPYQVDCQHCIHTIFFIAIILLLWEYNIENILICIVILTAAVDFSMHEIDPYIQYTKSSDQGIYLIMIVCVWSGDKFRRLLWNTIKARSWYKRVVWFFNSKSITTRICSIFLSDLFSHGFHQLYYYYHYYYIYTT